jgi:NMD protein affecting ribosome stability and mRNA decay
MSPDIDEYIDVRDMHPDYSEMECWNCGATERIGPNRHMRICHNCFMDNSPTDHESESTVEGPDGELYVDYRLLWYGDVSRAEARRRYKEKTADIREQSKRYDARDRAVRL